FFRIVVVHLAAECFKKKRPAFLTAVDKQRGRGGIRVLARESPQCDVKRFTHAQFAVYHTRLFCTCCRLFPAQPFESTRLLQLVELSAASPTCSGFRDDA